MMGDLKESKLHPLLAIFLSIFTMVFGLIMAKSLETLYFFLALYIVYILFGMWKSALKILPFTVIVVGIFCGLTYLISKDLNSCYAMANRLLAVMLAVLPGMNIRPVDFTRFLNQIHCPRAITLGMMICLSFMPLLSLEIKQIKEAMRVRGVNSSLNPKVFYRAFLIPLTMRLVNISDTLSLSVEARGFDMHNKNATVYQRVCFRLRDFLLLFFVLAISSGLVVYLCMR